MIHGVVVKKLKVIPDERGRLMEILRSDDPFFMRFGQAYLTTAYPGVVKAWHAHRKQTDNLTAVMGMAKFVLYDDRENSPTRREINEFFAGEHNPILVSIPPGVYHGYKCIGECECLVINIPSEVYNSESPDEIRVDPHHSEIPYDWSRKDK
jgi:dTDP-4-dehydrorhamnose 3,5-epimerase